MQYILIEVTLLGAKIMLKKVFGNNDKEKGFIKLTLGVNLRKHFHSSLIKRPIKLECSSVIDKLLKPSLTFACTRVEQISDTFL
jgi:hypothetical protein